mgnify:FL=1|tara:strand:+ start:774 stop:1361 length:588 start_codon:yes stop_codon:yes gene_type:complete
MMMQIINNAIKRISLPCETAKEDLYSYGWQGYEKALKTYKDESTMAFDDYAEWKVKYAIIDGLRKENPLSRGSIELKKAKEHLIKKGVEVNNESLCEELGVGKTRLRVMSTTFVELDEDLPFYDLGFNIMDARILLSFGFSGLTSRELSVIWMHFYRGDTLADIGKSMRISESGASRIKKEALEKMRAAMTYDEV